MWQCPNCNKTFAKVNQHHQCVEVPVQEIFLNKSPHLSDVYQHLLNQLHSIGGFTVTTSLKSITLYGPQHKSFLIIQPKRKWIDIWFPLDHKVEDFPVFKIQQPSKSRYAHFVRLEDEEDLSPIVLEWIAEAHQLTNPS